VRNIRSNEIEGTISILIALMVLYTAMIDPVLAAGIAVFALAALGTHECARSRRQLKEK
jgi:hypothetical protein